MNSGYVTLAARELETSAIITNYKLTMGLQNYAEIASLKNLKYQ